MHNSVQSVYFVLSTTQLVYILHGGLNYINLYSECRETMEALHASVHCKHFLYENSIRANVIHNEIQHLIIRPNRAMLL